MNSQDAIIYEGPQLGATLFYGKLLTSIFRPRVWVAPAPYLLLGGYEDQLATR